MRKFLILVIISVVYFNLNAQTDIPKAQAMFIYNFSRLIEWPASYKSGPFIIGFVGSSTTFEQMEAFSVGKSVGSQPISVQRFATIADISTCHILFVPFSKTKEMVNILAKLQGKSTLIITEKNGAINDGSALNFVVIDDKLKFEFKPDNAVKYQIKVSSKLNEMAYKLY
jgi:hypothetical protein